MSPFSLERGFSGANQPPSDSYGLKVSSSRSPQPCHDLGQAVVLQASLPPALWAGTPAGARHPSAPSHIASRQTALVPKDRASKGPAHPPYQAENRQVHSGHLAGPWPWPALLFAPRSRNGIQSLHPHSDQLSHTCVCSTEPHVHWAVHDMQSQASLVLRKSLWL